MSITKLIVLAMVLAVAIAGYFTFSGLEKEEDQKLASKHVDAQKHGYTNWKRYTEPTGRFTITLPSMPQHATESVADPKTKMPRNYEMFVAPKGDGSVFTVTLVTLAEMDGKETEDEVLHDYMNELLSKNPKNELKDVKNGNFLGYKTLDFTIHNDELDVVNRIFLKDKTIYVLAEGQKLENKPADADGKDYEFFLESFQLTPNKPVGPQEKEQDGPGKTE